MFLLQEKPLQYYKLLCRLASDSRESDRLTLQVKTIKQGAWALEFWTKRFAKTFPSFDIDGRNKNLAFIDTQSNV